MPNPYFCFKQFAIYQDRCAMKVGTDGVLLGAWTNCEGAKQILDVGTGTGLIALMLAQRSNAFITAIEIDENAAKQASENAANSPWGNRVIVKKCALQDFTSDIEFDLIVCNPPYFNNSLKSPADNRNLARHTDSLSINDLLQNSLRLLSASGRLCVILPADETNFCIEQSSQKGLFCTRSTKIKPLPNSDVKRILLEFSRTEKEYFEDFLIIEKNRHEYSEEFKKLTDEYYLKL